MTNQIELVKEQAYLQVANENALTVQTVTFTEITGEQQPEVSNCKGTAGTFGTFGCACGCAGSFGSLGTYGCGA